MKELEYKSVIVDHTGYETRIYISGSYGIFWNGELLAYFPSKEAAQRILTIPFE